MEEMIMRKKQPTFKSPTPSMLSLHRDSRLITKVKPKIRIIHVFATEIIKTDVENFRELVQRLTGKPSNNLDRQSGCKKKVKLGVPRKEETRILQHHEKSTMGRKMESRDQKLVKKEEGMFMMRISKNNNNNNNPSIGENSSGGYLGEFADLNGFIEELGGLPLSPVDSHSQSHYHMHSF